MLTDRPDKDEARPQSRLLDRRPPDLVVPACERPDDGLGANGVGAVHELLKRVSSVSEGRHGAVSRVAVR